MRFNFSRLGLLISRFKDEVQILQDRFFISRFKDEVQLLQDRFVYLKVQE